MALHEQIGAAEGQSAQEHADAAAKLLEEAVRHAEQTKQVCVCVCIHSMFVNMSSCALFFRGNMRTSALVTLQSSSRKLGAVSTPAS